MSDLEKNRGESTQSAPEEVDLDRVLATDETANKENVTGKENEAGETGAAAEESEAKDEVLAEDVDKILDDISEEEKQKRRKKVRTYNRVRRVLLVIMIGVFVYAAYSLADIYLNYERSNQTYNEVQSLFYVEVDETETVAQTDASGETVAETETDESGETVYATSISGTTTKWVWDYQKLLEVNSDALGWISLSGTVIDYPILQGVDNDTYLHASIYGDYAYAGSIFVDYRNTLGLEGHYCIIYGHNMNNGSMFGTLKKYRDSSYLKEHPYFDIYIGEKHYIYYVYSLYIVEPYETADSPYQFGYEVIDTDEKREAYEEFLADTVSKSMYTVTTCPKTEITADDYVITLSTCSGSGANKKRMIVHLVRCEEVAD
ncbi:MAG: class B sortase [Lachnospiraceae bacterium]|nr:class B sortase [Lachnospiraceae bacterium]